MGPHWPGERTDADPSVYIDGSLAEGAILCQSPKMYESAKKSFVMFITNYPPSAGDGEPPFRKFEDLKMISY